MISYTCKLSNHDNNKFIFMLGKGDYPYEYKVHWVKI